MAGTHHPVLRPARASDENFLFTLYAGTRAEEMAASGWNRKTQEAFLRQQYAARRADYGARFPQAEQSVVTVHGENIGTLLVNRSETEIRLVDFALVPAHRNQGLGRLLLESLLAEARTAGKPVKLHVLTHSPAKRLYARLGFILTGNKGEYVAMTWLS